MDDLRFGAVIRAIRIRKRLRQKDLARLADVSPATVSRIERGHLDVVSLASIRAVAKALDVRVDLMPLWRAGDLDRLLNSRHSALHEQVARSFAERPWLVGGTRSLVRDLRRAGRHRHPRLARRPTHAARDRAED